MEITRRKLIGTGFAAPPILRTQDKAGSKAPALGEGAFPL
jgi:hypothetical protein